MIRVRLAFAAILAAGLALQAPGTAQKPEATPPFGEVVDVEVVDVDVVVVDREGLPVIGLAKEDFAVFEDGEPREITNFYAFEGIGATIDRHRAGERVALPDEYVESVRRIAILFDTNTLMPRDRNRAVDAAERFVSEKFDGTYEWAVVGYGDEVRVLQPFTSDKYNVLNALARIKELPLLQAPQTAAHEFISEDPDITRTRERARSLDGKGTSNPTMQDFEVRERVLANLKIARKTASAAVNTMRSYARMPGRKSLVLVSGVLENLPTPGQLIGKSFPGAGQDQDRTDPLLLTLQQELQMILGAMVQTANAAGFSIYPMSALGINTPSAPHMDIEYGASPYRDSFAEVPSGNDVESAPRMLADGTGGRFFQSTRYYEAFHDIDSSTSSAYVLGFRTVRPPDRGYHKIRVEVKKKGLDVKARHGYLHLSIADRLIEELSTPLAFPKERGEIPVSVSIAPTPTTEEGRLVVVSAAMPVRDITLVPEGTQSHGRVRVFLAVYDAEGKLMDIVPNAQDILVENEQMAQALDPELTATFALKVKLKPGTYTFSLTLMDQVSSRFGTALERRAI